MIAQASAKNLWICGHIRQPAWAFAFALVTAATHDSFGRRELAISLTQLDWELLSMFIMHRSGMVSGCLVTSAIALSELSRPCSCIIYP